MDELTNIIDFCKINNRICPQPQMWNKLWKLLKNKKRSGAGWKPPLPLILSAWYHSSDNSKRKRLLEHLNWAKEQNQLNTISDYLQSLNESDWYHENE